jgi:hypothetical protein
MPHLSSPLCSRYVAAIALADIAVLALAVALLLDLGNSSSVAAPAPPTVQPVAVRVEARSAVLPARASGAHRPAPSQRALTTASHRRASTVRPATSRRRSIAPPPRPRVAVTSSSASSWSADFAAAVGRIPGYVPGGARWVVSTEYGSWGTADWYRGIVYISPRVPRTRLYDVAVHEWSHLLSVRPYAGNVDAAVAAMNTYFGGSGMVGAERAADCMALLLSARWTHYTSCADSRWRAGAQQLLRGEQL